MKIGRIGWSSFRGSGHRIRPDATGLNFPNTEGSAPNHYVNFLGKCEEYNSVSQGMCEWEGRMYNTNANTDPTDVRCNRVSGYVFGPTASFGSGADWQPSSCSLFVQGHWYHVVVEYTTDITPTRCSTGFPGKIDIWINGVKWNDTAHGTTGCMSQYSTTPTAGSSSFRIGTTETRSYFQGAIGKVAIYNYRLSDSQIASHFETMKNATVNGNCTQSGGTCTLASP